MEDWDDPPIEVTCVSRDWAQILGRTSALRVVADPSILKL